MYINWILLRFMKWMQCSELLSICQTLGLLKQMNKNSLQFTVIVCSMSRCFKCSNRISSLECRVQESNEFHTAFIFHGCLLETSQAATLNTKSTDSNPFRHNLFAKIKHSFATFTLVECTNYVLSNELKRIKRFWLFSMEYKWIDCITKALANNIAVTGDGRKMWNKIAIFCGRLILLISREINTFSVGFTLSIIL